MGEWTAGDAETVNLCYLCVVETMGDFKEGE